MGIAEKHLRQDKLYINNIKIVKFITKILHIKYKPKSTKFSFLSLFLFSVLFAAPTSLAVHVSAVSFFLYLINQI